MGDQRRDEMTREAEAWPGARDLLLRSERAPGLLGRRSAAGNARPLHEIHPTRLGDAQKEVEAIVEDEIQHTRKLQELLRKSLWDLRQQSLPMLKPLKSPCRLDLEWWAVQGSNL
ncbi:hypothetical protein [Xanthomonas arboricola]|uniref:hypothetical protein n=1 Tax=Xanthomonas arboricola TaxID=56448 RepID=UPI000E1E4F87|nr:hypothetical protein [Xanthomonas arboricola]